MEFLLRRLDDIGQSIAESDDAQALIGLGSVGLELERLDSHSDLDFFVIVDDGFKAPYLNDLAWETEVWIAAAPTHLVHLNGDRFLGPHG